MKKILLFFSLITIIACNEEPKDYAILKGKITNKENGVVTINSLDRFYIDTLEVKADGTFHDTLRIEPDHYMIYDGKNNAPLYINKGDEIQIDYDSKDFLNTLTLSGQGSEISNYLLSKRKTEKEMMGEGTEVYLLDEAAYKAKFKAIKDTLSARISAAEGISEAYKAKEQRNLNYSYLSKINMYQLYHAHYAEKPDFEASETFLDELDGLDYNNVEDFKFSRDYEGLVTSHYRDLVDDQIKADSTLKADLTYLKVVSDVEDETIKNKLLYDNAKYGITYTEDLETFYKLYMVNATNDKYKDVITESYNKLKTVAKGQPSPKFVDYENHAGGTTSLDDLKGKYVYVDVWATWCGPCKREIPFLKEVEEKYHDKNIEFVSISVDRANDHEKWKTMVEEKELGGIQLFADNDWKSSFVEDYLIKGIPRFILIDPSGNIVSSNAPRPSDEKLIDLFNELEI